MDTVAIRIPSPVRGAAPREFHLSLGGLSDAQRETLQWLPRDRRGLIAELRGPTKTTKAQACLVDVGGRMVAADFVFEVPEQVIDADVPSLLDLWRAKLNERRDAVGRRAQRKAERAQAGGEAAAKPRPGKDRPQRGAAGACDVPADADAVVGAGWAPQLAEVYRCLPLLRSIELDATGGPDALTLDGQVWSALVQIEGFGEKGIHLRRVDQVLQLLYGDGWCDGEFVEDVGGRIEQACEAAAQSHAVLVEWLGQYRGRGVEAAAAPQTEVEDGEGKKGRRKKKGASDATGVEVVRGVVGLADLGRQIFVDLGASEYWAKAIRAEPDAHQEWSSLYAQAWEKHADAIKLALEGADFPARMETVLAWVTDLAPLKVSPQMSLWTAEDHRRLQRAVEAQVKRARQWLEAWKVVPADAAAAIAVLLLIH